MATRNKPRAEPRVPLSRERVLQAAVKIADEGGVQAVTMRRLAEEVGAEAMSLYYHVANKEEVLDGIAEVIMSEINDVVDRINVPADVAGQVEAVGKDVTEFRPGDAVFAMPKQGGFAEYVCVQEGELAPKPKSLSFEQAAAVPMAAGTALLALRDEGRIQPSHKVLVNGASGGVGTFAVHLARAFDAQVTGVCSKRNVDLVRSLGADEVIDYTAADFTRLGHRYDLLLDIAGGHSGLACRRVLTPTGTFVAVGGPPGRWLQPAGHMFAALALSPFVSQRMVLADVVGCTENKQNLMTLAEFIEDGKVTPVIDRGYPFADIPAAIKYQEEGHAAGKVVITI